ncbi:leucine-rich repeat-containing protein 19-like isoform X1 [Epinephelus moara]|uniref:leucine-rich repeat-containing protein 19-like isoform X1 n=1 Tax=Epinephelus moara TaxID=300413 RepID=UPI00214E455C|nr:leucine-rich repeat-containing protein 19-like isoform X1 [Epinephelus moara]
MENYRQPLLVLWLTAVVAMNIHGSNAEAVGDDILQVKNFTSKLQVIPHNDNSSNVTKLVIEESLITLSDDDRLALASYPTLVELHLDDNQVTSIPAKYFSVVPNLRVLSLTRNKISSLDPESFSDLDVLTELDLSHNLLASVPSQLFRQLKNLQVLNLQDNPWNCSCLLLSSMEEIKAAGVTTGGQQVTCASPEKQAGTDLLQATAMCYPSSPPAIDTTDPQTTTKPVTPQQSWGSSTVLKTILTSSQNRNINIDPTPVLGNTWKFTACVMALALCTSMLIACGMKGPSWYKLFHNYRHRRLRQEEDEEDTVSTVFSETGRHMTHQTFTFEQEDGQIEEGEEDEYFEDPYIRREGDLGEP